MRIWSTVYRSRCTMCIGRMSMSITTSTYLMELNTISSILSLAIESYMREIVPYRECDSIDYVRQEELVEHQEDAKRYDCILVRHHISPYRRDTDYILVVVTIAEPDKYSSNLEQVCLLYHIENDRDSRESEKHANKKELKSIYCLMCCLRYNETTVEWEQHSKDEYSIYGYTDDQCCKRKWK